MIKAVFMTAFFNLVNVHLRTIANTGDFLIFAPMKVPVTLFYRCETISS